MYSTKNRCGACCARTSATITHHDCTYRWKRTRQPHAQSSPLETSSQFPKSADCTIGTNVERPEVLRPEAKSISALPLGVASSPFKRSRPAADAETPHRYNPKITNRNVHFAPHRLEPSNFRQDEVFGRDTSLLAISLLWQRRHFVWFMCL